MPGDDVPWGEVPSPGGEGHRDVVLRRALAREPVPPHVLLRVFALLAVVMAGDCVYLLHQVAHHDSKTRRIAVLVVLLVLVATYVVSASLYRRGRGRLRRAAEVLLPGTRRLPPLETGLATEVRDLFQRQGMHDLAATITREQRPASEVTGGSAWSRRAVAVPLLLAALGILVPAATTIGT